MVMDKGIIIQPGVDGNNITIIDETIREGMQHRGIVFSKLQRENILEFQETLGVDVCQAGYAPAHSTEQEHITHLQNMAVKRGFRISLAGMGRAWEQDVPALVATGIKNYHLHAHIPHDLKMDVIHGKLKTDTMQGRRKTAAMHGLEQLGAIRSAVDSIRSKVENAVISVAVLDIGAVSMELLVFVSNFLAGELGIEIISLPDTSGIMAPDQFHDCIKFAVQNIQREGSKSNRLAHDPCHELTRISVHCHNDLGMASANTLMGVKAGATVVELSALGIGERNGIADLFTVGRFLRKQGYDINLNVNDTETFKKYYGYVSDICMEQTGESLLHYCTPFFGESAMSHVAGTHAKTGFGLFENEMYFINVLCGKGLVKKYLDAMDIPYDPLKLKFITETIKCQSAALGRRLEKQDILEITRTPVKLL
ncbi:MAG: hypothetical protein HQK66_05380 [Desulfamplus sp.]|nr:hypothetical protein [Desulfamplus sp.]